jgi:AhpD family alkylhydroperoxidase
MRADIHDGPEQSLQAEAGYIDARPQHRQIDEILLRRTAEPYIRVKLDKSMMLSGMSALPLIAAECCTAGASGHIQTSLLFRSDRLDGVISSIAVAGRSDVIARWSNRPLRKLHSSLESRRNEMSSRANYQKSAPAVFQSMLALHMATRKSGLPAELLDLVDYRVSQINACAFCLDMHSKDLRARGETEQRLYGQRLARCPKSL